MPFASVIIPVHARHSTLPFALQSIQAQSQSDIEIIIAGDGCTSEVRSICERFASKDSRIIFLDLPKTPLRGVKNRDHAVRSASSEKIFYCDDDDFFLKDHIKILGDELADCEIVDTPPVTLCPEGHIELGLHDSNHPIQKKLLLKERFKGVFDTHMAHTKASYMSHAGAWLNANDPRVVLHMLKAFASNEALRWKTINRATAISLHGARRCAMSPNQRQVEMQNWSDKIGSPDFETWIKNKGRYGWHLFRLLNALRTQDESHQEEFWKHLGFSISEGAIHVNPIQQTSQKWTAHQTTVINAMLAFFQRRKYDFKQTAILCDELLDPLLGPGFPGQGLAGHILQIYEFHEASEILSHIAPRPAKHLLQFHLKLLGNRHEDQDLKEISEVVLTTSSYDQFFFSLSVAEGLYAKGLLEACYRWSTNMFNLRSNSRFDLPFWKLRSRLTDSLQLKTESKWIDQQLHWFEGKI